MIGQLKHRVIVQKLVLMPDDQGGKKEYWSTHVTVWASITTVKAGQQWYADHLPHIITHKIIIRNREDITNRMRIKHGTKIYQIHSINSIDVANGYLELLAYEGTPS